MKRIKNSDIRIDITGYGLPERYNFRFYTLDPSTYIEKTEADVDIEGEKMYLGLDWSLLILLGEGVLRYDLTKHIPDETYPDGYYDAKVTRSTNYYIISSVQPIPPTESASTLETVIELISLEQDERMSADQNLQDQIDAFSGVTKEYVDQQDAAVEAKIPKEWTGTKEEYDSLSAHTTDITYYII